MHEVCLKLDELPLFGIAGSVTSEQDFVHKDRIMKEHVLICLYGGEMEVVEDKTVYRIRPGEFLFLKAGVHHWGQTVIKAGTSWFYVHFSLSNDMEGYRPYDDSTAGIRRQGFEAGDYRCYITLPKYGKLPSHGLVDRRIKELLELYDSSDPLRIAHLSAMLFELLADIFGAANEQRKTDKAEILVQKLISFLEAHATAPLSSEEIGAYMRRNYQYLCAVFKEKTGLSIHQYHTRLRINEAARLLRETSLNVSEVSYAVGYRDPLYFSGVFKSLQGNPPSEYLKQTYK